METGAGPIAVFLWVRLKERRRRLSSVGVLVPLGLGVYETGVFEHTTVGMDALPFLVPLVLLFVFQATTEEAVTRGYMLRVGLITGTHAGWNYFQGTSSDCR